MPHVRARALFAVMIGLGGVVLYQQVSAEPAPPERAAAVADDAAPPRVRPSTTTTTTAPTTTTTVAPSTTAAPPPLPRATTPKPKPAPAPAPAPAPPPPPPPTATVQADPGAESEILSYINSERSNRGIGSVSMNGAARGVARNWSSYMASHSLAHNPNFGSQLRSAGVNWQVAGENVGQGQRASQVHNLFMSSGGTHYQNIVNPEYSQVGIGVTNKNGELYITVDFVGY